MNTIIGLIVGLVIGLTASLMFQPEPVVKLSTQVVERVVQEEVLVEKDCPAPEPNTERQCIEPSYVLGLMKDCRAGKLDQTDSDVTVRK